MNPGSPLGPDSPFSPWKRKKYNSAQNPAANVNIFVFVLP